MEKYITHMHAHNKSDHVFFYLQLILFSINVFESIIRVTVGFWKVDN